MSSIKDAIVVRPRGGNLTDADVKKFLRKTRDSGLMDELRAREGFDKPSVKRRQKRLMAIHRRKMEENPPIVKAQRN